MNVVSKQQCAFVQFTARSSAETAAEKSFNKLIINGRRLNIKWGKSQGQQLQEKDETKEEGHNLEPVPGLPGGKLTLSHNNCSKFMKMVPYITLCVPDIPKINSVFLCMRRLKMLFSE